MPFQHARQLIIKHHYSGRSANTIYAFGLYDDETALVGAITFGKPASPQVAKGCVPDEPSCVIELNRLVITTSQANAASQLVSKALKALPRAVVVSYADRGQGHTGFIYQATNFYFAGETIPNDSEYLVNGKRVHPRNLTGRGVSNPRQWAYENGISSVPPEPKYRYLIVTGTKRERKCLMKKVAWPLSRDYPKNTPPLLNRDSGAKGKRGLFY